MDDENKATYGKRPLWQWVILYVVVAIAIYGLIYYFVLAKKGGSYNSNTAVAPTAMQTSPTQNPTATSSATGTQKFSDSNDFQYAYKIFPGTLSTASKQAMAGFAFTTKAMPDGSTQVTLTSQNTEYKTQQYTVKTGYSLYFIERNLKDDDPENDTDRTIMDDTAILVDPQGNIAN